MNKEPRTIN